MTVSKPAYRERVEGCWAGKCLAGAIGMPYEGVPHSPNLRPGQIHVQDVPNDDLELQLVWLLAMERHGLSLRAQDLVRPWIDDIRHGCDEYSIALRNLRHGVMPPESGCADNRFVASLAHVELAFDPRVLADCLELIKLGSDSN